MSAEGALSQILLHAHKLPKRGHGKIQTRTLSRILMKLDVKKKIEQSI